MNSSTTTPPEQPDPIAALRSAIADAEDAGQWPRVAALKGELLRALQAPRPADPAEQHSRGERIATVKARIAELENAGRYNAELGALKSELMRLATRAA